MQHRRDFNIGERQTGDGLVAQLHRIYIRQRGAQRHGSGDGIFRAFAASHILVQPLRARLGEMGFIKLAPRLTLRRFSPELRALTVA